MDSKLMPLAGLVLLLGSVAAAEPQQAPYSSVDGTLPPLRAMIERYSADRRNLGRFYDAPMSARRTERYGDFYRSWQYGLDETDFDALDHDGQVDYILFRNELRYRLEALEHERAKHEQLDELIPFAQTIVGLQERRRQLESIDPEQLAVVISELADTIDATRESVDAALELEQEYDLAVSNRAAEMLDRLQRTFKDWYGFYNGYDPLFSWWVATPYAKADKQLTDYTKFVRKSLVGIEDDDQDDPIIGDPIGRAELLTRLEYEMIPYTPDELLVIAETELAWCRREMLRAAAALGFGDD
ncbi:MAG: hypothetical protein V3S08_06230, partial [Phycisphaerales bacterium]